MKDRDMALNHLLGFSDFHINDKDVGMGILKMTQEGKNINHFNEAFQNIHQVSCLPLKYLISLTDSVL